MSEYKSNYQELSKKNRRRRVKRLKILMSIMGIVLVILVIYVIVILVSLIGETIEYNKNNKELESIQYEIGDDIDKEYLDGIPEELLESLQKNPELEEFVLQYPSKKGSYSTADLDEYLGSDQVPLFLQWDSRWGYYNYGGSVLGVTGCGPTCLSMVALHLLQDPELTPIYIADYATRSGYYAAGIGTSWELMTDGATSLGLSVAEVPLTETIVLRYLQQGHPIIAAMGPGDFTESGHFIVFVGTEDGKIIVNDPNSKSRSKKLWEFEDIKYQIKNMWVYSV